MSDASILSRLAGARVAVIGDIMLDTHVVGQASRISDEAPVPVLLVQSERQALGGAANVAANIAALGGRAALVGFIGADAAGEDLRAALAGHAGIAPALIVTPHRPTITKTRFLSGQHQLVRVDRERIERTPADEEAALIAAMETAIAGSEVVVLSDYGKGVLSDAVLEAAFAAAAKAGVPAIVDPKRTDFAAYRGAAYITPNRKELRLAVGLPVESDAEAEAAAAAAIAASGAAILLTRSEKGMSLYRAGQAAAALPAEAREVFDVSGAGDTVVAGLALGLAAGLPPEQAMRIANAAAAVVVGKIGTAIVSPPELAAALKIGGRDAPARDAPAPLDSARAMRERWRSEGLVVGFTNGCFDLVHAGHVSLIAQAAGACDRLIVGLNSDASVSRLKGPTRPVQPLAARAAVMNGLKGVDLVVAFEEDTPLALIEALKPDVLIKGADYREDQVVGGELVKSWGGRIVLADLTPGQSTTSLVQKAKI